jgi:hypothetical protein
MMKAMLLLGLGLALTACNGDDEPEPKPAVCEAPEGERGTPECRRYHEAYCRWIDECGNQDQCDCVDEASGIACTSETEATRCADAFESASCSSIPQACLLTDLADRDVAQAGCEQYLTTVCNLQTRCRGMDPAQCLTEARMLLDCTTAIGLKPVFDVCLPEIDALECSETDLPASCEGALLLEG